MYSKEKVVIACKQCAVCSALFKSKYKIMSSARKPVKPLARENHSRSVNLRFLDYPLPAVL